ncbi:MAG: hypothetical protein NTX87_10215 [Planctomycetota bacterium]|nr:hypothetical protein [Planctomycetota bacterium]
MNRGNRITGLLLAAFLAAAGQASAKTPAGLITISVARDQADAPVRAGEPLAIRITLRNATPGPLMVPDWEHFAEEIDVRVSITGYPGEHGNEAAAAAAPWPGVPFQRGDFRELPPGETTVVRTVTPLLPGKARITVAFESPSDTYLALTDGKPVRMETAWTGHIDAAIDVDVPPEMSAEMKKRYNEMRERLADPLVPGEQRGRLLAIVADEKHYFAARFVQEMSKSLPAGAMRDAALWQLAKLAKAGAGYEGIPALLDAMTDANVEQTLRVALLEWAALSLTQKGRLPIAEQAIYVWPDDLLKRAREQMKRLTEDSNPYFAAKAKELLRRAEEPGPK